MSIRLRFAIASAAVFLVLSSLVLLAAYLIVQHSLGYRAGLITPNHMNLTSEYGTHGWYGPARVERFTWQYEATRSRVLRVRAVYERDTLANLRDLGALAVLLGTAGAFGVGYRTAGWIMRPLGRVTETARRVAQSHNLSERIGYQGPRDEIGELAETYDVMLARLARAFDGQRRFVANASHELRTPLTINRTLVDVAVRRPDATEDLKRLGESLLLVNARNERLIDGLLALAEGEQAVLDRRGFDLADVAEHVLDQASEEAAKSEVTIHRLLDAAPTSGEPVLVERLVQNLVENAIRHNHPLGEVWVTTRQRAGVAELVVANSGLPVPAYELESIFEPFRRLHGDRLRSDRGSGLGLSIVRVIADAHRGTVTARPRDEGGLTISVELPGGQTPSDRM
jgi:signal transduction histidine kinase